MKKTLIFLVVVIVAISAILFVGKSPFTSKDRKDSKAESIAIKGSDTELQLVSNLVESFNQENPRAKISVAGGGSGTGIAALLNGEIEIADSSRSIKQEERNQAVKKGLSIQDFILARDGLSIIVNPFSSVEKVTLANLGKIYRGEITNWKEIGGSDKPIVLYGRQTTSGTYVFFRDTVLKGDYAPQMKNMEGNQAIVDSVKNDKNGIGYVGIGYIVDDAGAARKDIKVIKISSASEDSGVSPLDAEAVKLGKYPLSRPLFQYLAQSPNKGSLTEKFLQFESSLNGLEVITKTGFFPPTQEDILKNKILFETINK